MEAPRLVTDLMHPSCTHAPHEQKAIRVAIMTVRYRPPLWLHIKHVVVTEQ